VARFECESGFASALEMEESIMTASTDVSGAEVAYMFFNENQARSVEAIAERVFPGDPSGGGAREAAVIVYIDRALAGYGKNLHRLYRRGLGELDRYTSSNYAGRAFIDLTDSEQDDVLGQMEKWGEPVVSGRNDRRSSNEALLGEFFGAVRLHTIEGMFCDPMYGGNRNAIGWKLIGFPGAQWGYSAEQMRLGFDATTIPVKTLADLRLERVVKNDTTEEAR
jgi:gluconate 2-dehydrogenase gamma chain